MAENQLVTLCTVPDREAGERIAAALVAEQLAACVNLVPGLSSTYRWQGKVKKETECLLIIKTDVEHFEALRECIQAIHPYDLPEIIALPISTGSSDYLKWMSECLK